MAGKAWRALYQSYILQMLSSFASPNIFPLDGCGELRQPWILLADCVEPPGMYFGFGHCASGLRHALPRVSRSCLADFARRDNRYRVIFKWVDTQ